MAYETTPENAFDLVIRVGFYGTVADRAAYLEHYSQPGTIEVNLTPIRTDPARPHHKARMIVTHVGVQDPLDIPGSVIF